MSSFVECYDYVNGPEDPPIDRFGATTELRLTLLGRMAATGPGGADLRPRSRKTRALLAILALSEPEPVLRSQVVALLWSRREREQAYASQRQAVRELQRTLAALAPDLLVADRALLRLRAGAVRTDVSDYFRDAAATPRGPAGVPGRLLQDLRGVDQAFDQWLDAQQRRIDLAASRHAAQRLALAATPEQAIEAAGVVLALDPMRERAWQALMQAHLARGERAAALSVYERCAAALLAQAGVEPGPELRELREAVRREAMQDGTLPDAPQAAARPGEPGPHHGREGAREGARGGGRGVRLGVMPFRALHALGEAEAETQGGGAAAPGEPPDETPLELPEEALTEGLAEGLAEEITTALSRFRWIYLVASPSLAALSGELREGSARWRMLDLDFLLDGTVQRAGRRVRVNVRLLDLHAGGEVVWARRFDRTGGDILTLQDEIAAEAVAQIDPALLLREGRRARSRPATSLTAYDMVLRAVPALYRLEQASFEAAGEALRRAIVLDPEYGAARAWLAYYHVFLVGQGWAADPDAAMAEAGRLAEQAVRLDPADARALTIAGHVRAFLYHQVREAIELHEQALALNPNLPLAWAFAGLAQSYVGAHEAAIRRMRKALQLSPFDPHGFFFEMALMMPHLMLRQHGVVMELGRRATALNPGLSSTYKGFLSALGHAGEREETEAVRRRLLALEPDFTCRGAGLRSPLRRPEDVAYYVEGLRRAGLPE